ncbi:MAG: peptidoglycan-binding domain-containing protein [Candidatus Sericytochromatia bacterium]|nr:peptidoglycan-binding domain-containing protein [Candidatus Sericytochromatia bacterium]
MTLPISSFSPAPAAPRAPLGGSAPPPSPAVPGYAVYSAAPQPAVPQNKVANVVDGVIGAIGRVIEGFLNLLKRLFRATQATAPAALPQPAYPSPGALPPGGPPTVNGLSTQDLALAQQQGILPTRDNLEAFLREAQALEATRALGPGSIEPAAIAQLQQVLQRLGYRVAPSGTWDQATSDAVLTFKRAQGLVASYRLANGLPAVHPFIDEPARQALRKALQPPPALPQPSLPAPVGPGTPAPGVPTPATSAARGGGVHISLHRSQCPGIGHREACFISAGCQI